MQFKLNLTVVYLFMLAISVASAAPGIAFYSVISAILIKIYLQVDFTCGEEADVKERRESSVPAYCI
jgi:hypothetical protein